MNRKFAGVSATWLLALGLAGVAVARPPATVVVEGTREVAAGYPRVHVQVAEGDRVLKGAAADADLTRELTTLLGGALPAQPNDSFMAFLDTGASANVLSRETVERFGIEMVEGARYHEFSLHGETPMGVTEPYRLALAGSNGKLADTPRGGFTVVDEGVAFEVNLRPPNPTVQMTMGSIDVIGMPAIRRLVVEIDPSPMDAWAEGGLAGGEMGLNDVDRLLDSLDSLGAGPAVTLHPPDTLPTQRDLVVPLEYRNFSRRQNPRDTGPRPTLSPNPMVRRVRTEHGDRHAETDWLLDTGAPASFISTDHARRLGVLDENGRPTQRVAFTLPIGGIEGQAASVSGYVIDRLILPAAGGRRVEFRDVHVLVHDVSAELDGGEVVTLDGVLGTNVMFTSVSGVAMGMPSGAAKAPFERVWIDGPRRAMVLVPAEHVLEASADAGTGVGADAAHGR